MFLSDDVGEVLVGECDSQMPLVLGTVGVRVTNQRAFPMIVEVRVRHSDPVTCRVLLYVKINQSNNIYRESYMHGSVSQLIPTSA
jgi:hypothetical protein